jgi:hypothetical protein
LLVAAAEPTGDPMLVWRAAERIGIGPDAAAAAEAGGLLVIGPRVRFRHLLVRSAVYRAAPPSERRAVHQALAEATDPLADPDRRAWHRAQAAPWPDEAVAAELERSAGRARARGGVAAAGAFLERAVALTLDPARRADRALAAAEAKLQVGALDAALGLLATAEAGPLNARQRARADLLRGQIAFVFGRGMDAPLLMLKAARQLEPLDVGMARATYLEALSTAMFAGRLAVGGGAQEVAEAARWAPASPQPAGAADLLLDGLALLITEGYAAGTPVLKQALQALLSEPVSNVEAMPWAWLAYHAAFILWDCESWRLLATRQVSLARDAGALVVLSHALDALSVAGTRPARPTPSSCSRRPPAPPARTGRWGPRRARAPCWPQIRSLRIFTTRRSTTWDAPACALSWPAPTCCTASGCAASAAGAMPAISFAPRTRSSSRPAPGRSPNARGLSCAQRARGPPNAPRRRKLP